MPDSPAPAALLVPADLVGRGGPSARWRWALTAAAVGAVAGVVAALLVRRTVTSVVGEDAPDAQDPADVVAVVDRPLG